MMERKKVRLKGTRAIVYCALFTALLIVMAQISLPLSFSAVPFSLGLLAVLLCGCLLGPLWGTVTVVVYILLGAIGLPVFAGFKPMAAITVTGGYIAGYIPAAFLAGWFSKSRNKILIFGGLVLAIIACYLPGVTWTAIYLNTKFFPTLASGMVFLPFDLVKAGIAGALTIKLKRHIR